MPQIRDGVYTRSDRKGFWISFEDGQGRRRQEKTNAPTLQQARSILAQKRAEAEKQRVLGYAPPSEDTFSEWAPRYLKHQKARLTPKAYERSEGVVNKHLKPVFGAFRLADIRAGAITRYITTRSTDGASAHTITKEFNILKHMFVVAMQQELIPTNPAHGVKTPRVPAGRLRYLQPTELRAVLEACPPWLRPIAALLAFTGMRRGELLGLRWLDVDAKGGRIMLPQSKNGEGRVIWLSEMACAVVDALPRGGPEDLVFPASKHISPENVSLALLRTCRKLKIADFRLHDLRHTAASWLIMTGSDIYTVAKLLGHKDVRMTARYAHLSPVHLQAAVQGLDRAFGPKAEPATVVTVPALPPATEERPALRA